MNMCANCGERFEGEVEFAIHRDGFGIGPEVPLCHDCGAYPCPTCAEIWFNIADRQAPMLAVSGSAANSPGHSTPPLTVAKQRW
jgi:NAD-dependent SIR2 family protein deacetylase